MEGIARIAWSLTLAWNVAFREHESFLRLFLYVVGTEMIMEKPDEEGRRGLAGVLALCAAIFFIDASHSVVIPIFPSFAVALGASMMVIGALGSASGVARALFSIPLGGLSDRLGRKRVMLMGMIFFAITPILYTVSSYPLSLIPARVVLGVGMASTFSIGFVYVSELAATPIRSVAQGLYLSSMGLGFTLGPLLGGITAKIWGYSVSFYLSSGFALIGLLILFAVPSSVSGENETVGRRPFEGRSAGFREVLAEPRMMAACLANFLNSMLFSALFIFFPLYGGRIGFDESQIGFGFAVRGLSSTLIRFPTGASAKRIGVMRLMTVGLGVSAVVLLVLPSFEETMVLSLLLGLQGVAYGIYLTAGNTFVTEEAPAELRGTAIGVYSTFSNISGVISPLMLGVIAEAWGLRGPFQVSAVLCLVGMVVMLVLVKKGEGSSIKMHEETP